MKITFDGNPWYGMSYPQAEFWAGVLHKKIEAIRVLSALCEAENDYREGEPDGEAVCVAYDEAKAWLEKNG